MSPFCGGMRDFIDWAWETFCLPCACGASCNTHTSTNVHKVERIYGKQPDAVQVNTSSKGHILDENRDDLRLLQFETQISIGQKPTPSNGDFHKENLGRMDNSYKRTKFLTSPRHSRSASRPGGALLDPGSARAQALTSPMTSYKYRRRHHWCSAFYIAASPAARGRGA